MMYRAGADPIRDVLAFCGPHNGGQLLDGHFLGHIWLEMDDELIDFSCGEWQHLDPRAELIGGLPPIRWQSPPPTFIWATRALFPWKSFGEPNTGEMWYGPWTGTPPDVADNLDMLIKNTAIVRAVEKNLAQAKLPERTAASRRYQVIAKLSPQMAEHEGVHVAGVVLAAVGDHIGHRVRPCTEQHRAVGQLGIQADLSQELVADQASHDAGASHHLHVGERPHGVGDWGCCEFAWLSEDRTAFWMMTPWSAPEPIFQKLVTLYPLLTLTCHFVEEGMEIEFNETYAA